MGKRRTVFFRELVPSNFFLRDSVFLRCGTKQFRASQVGQRVIGAVRQKREEEVLLCLTHCASSSACTVLPSQLEMPPENKSLLPTLQQQLVTTQARLRLRGRVFPILYWLTTSAHSALLCFQLSEEFNGVPPLLCKQKLPSLPYGGRVHTK